MTEKEFGILPINKIFFKLAIPGLLSMLFSSIGMIIDGVFVGRFIGSNALAAINLVMPIFMIIFALGDMIAVGSSVKVSIRLGEGDEKRASRLFSASLLSLLILSVILMGFGLIFGKNIVFYFIKDTALATLAYDYAKVFIFFVPFLMPLFAIDNYLRICGKSTLSMSINIGVALLNIILDAVLIGYFKLGIEYAALATVLSMVLGTVAGLIPFVLGKLTLKFTKPKVELSELIGVVYNGSSEFFNNISGSIMAIIINGLLLSLGGSVAVASYAIIMYIDSILISMLYGIQDSIQPAVSYNLGAQKISRTFGLFKICCVAAITISLLCMGMMIFYPDLLVSLFADASDQSIRDMTKTALLLYAPSYLFTWFNMIASSFLTSFDKPKESMIIMFAKAVVFPLISLVVMTSLIGVNGVYITPLISGAFTAIIAFIVAKKVVKNIRTLEASQDEVMLQ